MKKDDGKNSEITSSPKGSKRMGETELVKDSDDSSGSFWLSQSFLEQTGNRSDEKGASDNNLGSKNSSVMVSSITTVTETDKDSS